MTVDIGDGQARVASDSCTPPSKRSRIAIAQVALRVIGCRESRITELRHVKVT